MNPFTALTQPSPFPFTFYFILFLLILSTLHFTSLHFTLLFIPTTHFPSLYFFRLHFPSPVFTFLTLALKICVLPWEVPITPSGSRFMSNGPIHKGVFSNACSLFSGSDFPMMINPTLVAWCL